MRKFLKFILLVFVLLTSCEYESNELEDRYFFVSFFIPTRAMYYEYAQYSKKNALHLSSDEIITENNNPSEYFRLDNEYGENGKSRISDEPPTASNQPIGIETMKVYRVVGNEREDVSDQCSIKYMNYSLYVSEHFSSSITYEMMWVKKKVSELTDFDYKWMNESITLTLDFQNEGNVYLVISLDNGTEIEQRLLY